MGLRGRIPVEDTIRFETPMDQVRTIACIGEIMDLSVIKSDYVLKFS